MINKKKDRDITVKEMEKFLFINEKNNEISPKLLNYFKKYYDFCFDIINKNMLKDLDKFEY